MMNIDVLMLFLISLPQSSLRINPGQGEKLSTFCQFRWSQSIAFKKLTSTLAQVKEYCNWRKEA